MTIELKMLAWSALLGLVQVFLGAAAMFNQRSSAWVASSRDQPAEPLAGVAGRLDRSWRNFLETFPFFAVAVLVAHLAQRHNDMTMLGAQLYFWARLVYLPLYAAGIPYLRTLVWTISVIGLVMVLAALF
jgi:uncharacterized MAPEG superfamily protein